MIDIVLNKKNYRERDISIAFFEYEGRFFPQKYWTDFDRAIQIWCENLDENGSSDILFFMDGPYKFSVDSFEDKYIFKFYENYENELEEVDYYECSKQNYEDVLKKICDYTKLISIKKN